jgi:hypothetical protein
MKQDDDFPEGSGGGGGGLVPWLIGFAVGGFAGFLLGAFTYEDPGRMLELGGPVGATIRGVQWGLGGGVAGAILAPILRAVTHRPPPE